MAEDLPAVVGWLDTLLSELKWLEICQLVLELEGLIFTQKWHEIYQLELDNWSPCYLKQDGWKTCQLTPNGWGPATEITCLKALPAGSG
jgi:hypothetical protein